MNLDEQFMCAIKSRRLMAAALLSKTALVNINYQEKEYGYTALMFAAMNGDLEAFCWLHKNGASLLACDNAQRTALMFAACKSNAIVEYCLKQNISVDCKSSYNRTPLIFAIQVGKTDVVKTLLRAGADPNVLDLVENNGLHHVSLIPDTKAMKEIAYLVLKAGVNVDKKNKYGDTPLLTACKNKQFDLIIQLIEFGANIFETDAEGMTPFLQACYSDDTGTFLELLLTVPEKILFAQKNPEGHDGLSIARLGWSNGVLALFESPNRDEFIENHRKKKIHKIAKGTNVSRHLFNRQIGALHSLKADYYLRPRKCQQSGKNKSNSIA